MDQNLNGAQQDELQGAVSEQEQEPGAAAQTDAAAEQSAPEAADAAETAEAAAEEAAVDETLCAAENAQDAAQGEKDPKKKATLGIALAAVVALLAVAAIFLAQKLKANRAPENVAPDTANTSVSESEQTPDEAEQPQQTVPEGALIAHTNDAGYISYTMTDEQATDAVLLTQVAECGDWKLTNRALSYYYWEQYYTFASQYSQYLAYILDTTLGLDEQLCDGTNTWQQQFLDAAFRRFGMVAAVCQEAEAKGYTLDADAEQQLSEIRANLETSAALYGYESPDAIVQEAFGAHTNTEEYMEFVRSSLLASSYLNSLVEELEYTDEDISAYYDAHAEEFAQQGIEKVDKPMVSIRHILITPAETDENGEYTEQAWAEAQTEAERIYAEWQAGEQTEDTFAQLAMQYSADGNASSGGLYEDVYPGMMVTEFNDWCFDDSRAVGDSGIVKTQFGYHIMFYSGTSDEIYWSAAAKQSYLNEQASELLDEICSRYPVTSDVDQAAVSTLPGQQTQTTETEEAATSDGQDAAGEESAPAQTDTADAAGN